MKRLISLIITFASIIGVSYAQEIDNFPSEKKNTVETDTVVKHDPSKPHGIVIADAKSYALYLRPMGSYVSAHVKCKDNDYINAAPGLKGASSYNVGLGAVFRYGKRTKSSVVGTGKWAIEIDALYSALALKIDDKFATNDKMVMSSIEIPVLLQHYWYDYYVEAGTTIRTVLNTTPSEEVLGYTKYDLSDIKGNDMMITLGLGYSKLNSFHIGMRYNLGMSDLAKNLKVRVSTFTISAGWNFKLF